MIAPPKPRSTDELELLIKEARDRQRRRRVKTAAVVAVLAGLATSVYSVAAGGTAKPAAGAGRDRPLVTGPCDRASGWRLQSGGLWSEPTGQHTYPVELVREGSTACSLTGYPRIVLQTASGRTIPFRYSHQGDQVVSSKQPRPVHVAGRGKAFFLFNKYRCDYRETMVAGLLLVRLPGVHGVLRLRMTPQDRLIDYCPARPSTTVAVSPIVGKLIQATYQP